MTQPIKRGVCFVLCVCVLALAFPFSFLVQANTHTPSTAYTALVNGTGIRVRSGPGTQYTVVGSVDDGESVTVRSQTANGTYLWSAVTLADGTTGYIRSDLLKWYATTNRDAISVFSAPGDWNPRLVQLPLGSVVTVIDSAEDSDGDLWHRVTVSYNDQTYAGYVYAPQVSQEQSYDPDEVFEMMLTQENFPESYKPYLRQLHAAHPNWVFLAEEMPLSFQEALAVETVLGRSLYGGAYEAWKTMEPGAYNWDAGSYVSFDSGGWYAAHPDVVAYYLDPRNFLSDSGVFQFLGMSFDASVHSVAALQTMLNGTFMEGDFPEDGYATWADALYAAAAENGMSPYALASMIIQEQGRNGAGASISGTVSGYEGYYNFLNVGAYEHSGRSAVVNGLIYAKGSGSYGRPWDSRYKAISGGAAFYVKGYIAAGQDTLYLKKFDLLSAPYGVHQYMTNIQAAYTEAASTRQAYAAFADAALVFQIPVYAGMPETAVARPTTVGNNHFYLSDLAVEGAVLNESFDRYTETYTASVEGLVDTVTVLATAADGATIEGLGAHALQVGMNDVAIRVTATSGRQKTYHIYVTRQPLPEYHAPEYDLSGVTVDNGRITGLNAYTDCENFLAGLNCRYAAARIETEAGVEKQGYLATGNRLVICDERHQTVAVYPLVVRGDVSGDGKLTLLDLSLMKRHTLGLSGLSQEAVLAADINGDMAVNENDLALLQAHLLQKQSLLTF